jgi:hypothetical protein
VELGAPVRPVGAGDQPKTSSGRVGELARGGALNAERAPLAETPLREPAGDGELLAGEGGRALAIQPVGGLVTGYPRSIGWPSGTIAQ